MQVTLETAGEADVPALVRLNAFVQAVHASAAPDIFRREPGPEGVGDYFRRMIGQDGVEASLARTGPKGGAAVGFVLFEIQNLPETAFTHAFRQGFVHQIAVDPAHRQAQVGRRLMDHVRERLRAEGVDRLAADVWCFNEPAQAFFGRQGLMAERLKLAGAR